jgi:hypothetical protein
MTTPAPPRIRDVILQAIELLGGYATIDQIVTKAGYNRNWCCIKITELLEDGVLQRSNLMPALYSLRGKPLAPKVPLPLDRAGVLKLSKYAAHIYGRQNLTVFITNGNLMRGETPGFGTVQKLAELAGYKMMLVPIEDVENKGKQNGN